MSKHKKTIEKELSEKLGNACIVVYKRNVGYLIRNLTGTRVFLSCHDPHVFDYLSKDIKNNISDNYSIVCTIERDNIIDTIHYHHKDLSDKYNYFRISRKNDSVELYFPYQITDDEISKLIPNMEIYDVESYRSSHYFNDDHTFTDTEFLSRFYSIDKRLKPILKKWVEIPAKDWKIISQVGKLVNIVLEDIQPYRLYFAVDPNLEDIIVSTPRKYKDPLDGEVCERYVRFPLQETGDYKKLKEWAIAFSLGCFYKRYGENDPDRKLSDSIFAYYTILRKKADINSLQLRFLNASIWDAVRKILDEIWKKDPKERLEIIRKIWNKDYGIKDVEELKHIVS